MDEWVREEKRATEIQHASGALFSTVTRHDEQAITNEKRVNKVTRARYQTKEKRAPPRRQISFTSMLSTGPCAPTETVTTPHNAPTPHAPHDHTTTGSSSAHNALPRKNVNIQLNSLPITLSPLPGPFHGPQLHTSPASPYPLSLAICGGKVPCKAQPGLPSPAASVACALAHTQGPQPAQASTYIHDHS